MTDLPKELVDRMVFVIRQIIVSPKNPGTMNGYIISTSLFEEACAIRDEFPDPNLVLARAIVAEALEGRSGWSPRATESFLAGEKDDTSYVAIALAAIEAVKENRG